MGETWDEERNIIHSEHRFGRSPLQNPAADSLQDLTACDVLRVVFTLSAFERAGIVRSTKSLAEIKYELLSEVNRLHKAGRVGEPTIQVENSSNTGFVDKLRAFTTKFFKNSF